MNLTKVPQDTAPLVEVENLTIDFWNQDRWVNVVNRVAFVVYPGEAMGLAGESGCGKTTTVYTLLGYHRPNSRIRDGEIRFGGRDLLGLSGRELQQVRGRQVGFVPQSPSTALNPIMRVGAQILETMTAHGVGESRTERQARLHNLLAQVRLSEPAKTARKYPHQLSGGQQQRVVIAMALSCDPELMVLDEPTTDLDVTTQAQILELLVRLRSEHQMAMVYVTHDLAVLSSICDRVGVMYAGELVEDAPTRELFRNPRHPYTRGLIAAVPRVETSDQKRDVPLRGLLQRDRLPQGCRFAPRCDFAKPRCFSEPQQLSPVGGEHHRVACWRWPDIPALAEAEIHTDVSILSVDSHTFTPETLLEVRQLDCAYEFRRRHLFARSEPSPVVRDVSFDVKPSETFALVGESGSGKTTIARAVAGLLAPSAGKIVFKGDDITASVEARTKEQRRTIQFVPQNPDSSLNPRQRVSQIIGRPLEFFFDLKGPERRERIEQLLEDVRLDRSYADRFPDELSGGERQRIAIARALAADPKLMLCDEILSSLDVSVQAKILDLLRELQDKHKIAYLFISHDLTVVRSLACRVGVLYQGELCEVGQVEEIYSPPFHPYTQTLLSAVPKIEIDHAPGTRAISEPSVGAR